MRGCDAVRWALLACLAIQIAAPAHAQMPCSDDDPDCEAVQGFVGEESLILEQIPSVFTASKYAQRVTDAPSTVSVITAREIEAYGFRTLDDALRSLPGFFVTHDRNYSYVGVRGFARPGDYSSRVLVMVDGHRMNEAMFSQPYTGFDGPIDMAGVQRIEVIRGPGSGVYGTNALFAVVNVVTDRGRDLQGGQVGFDVASFRTLSGRAAYGRKLQSGLEAMASVSVRSSRGPDLYFEEFDQPETGDGKVRGADGALSYQGIAKISYGSLSLKTIFSQTQKGVPTAPYESEFPTTQTRTSDRRAVVELSWEEHLGIDLDLSSRIYYDHSAYRGRWLYDYADEGEEQDLVLSRDSARSESLGAEMRADWQATNWLRVVAAVEVFHSFVLAQQEYDELETSLDDQRSATSVGAFVHTEIVPHRNVTIDVGVRVDYKTRVGVTPTPRGALTYRPSANTTLKLLYGEAQRAPNAYEQYYRDRTTVDPAGTLVPERLRSVELAWEQTHAHFLRTTLSAYRYRVRGLISLEPNGHEDFVAYANAGGVTALGVEAALDARWPGILEARASYALQRAQSDDGSELTNSPRHMVKLGFVVPVWGEKLQVAVDGSLLSPRRTLADSRTGRVLLLDLHLSSRGLLPGLELRAGVRNMLDWRFGDPGSAEHVQDQIPQDGVTFDAGISYSF
jgi:outer membrane receptor for ferrienterochelin and colicins